MSDGWAQTTLGEAAEILMGQSPPGHTYNSNGEGLPFLQGSAEFGEHTPTPVKWCSAPAKIAEVGDLMVSVRAPVGDTNFADQKTAIGRGLAIVRARGDDMTEFLRLVIQHKTAELLAASGSGMFSSITAANLRGFQVSIPPLAVQRRIVDLMTHLDTHITNLRTELEAQRHVESLIRARLLVPGERAEVVTLGEVADWFSGGTPKADEPAFYQDGTIPWAVIADVNNGPVRSTAKCVTEEGLAKIGRLAPVGAVLVTMYGTIGRVGMAEIELTTNQAIAWGVAKEEILPKYLFHALLYLGPHLDALGRGATQRNINRQILRQQAIPRLSLDRQQEIVKTLDAAADLAVALDHEIATVSEWRRALLAGLLNGERMIDSGYDSLLAEVV